MEQVAEFGTQALQANINNLIVLVAIGALALIAIVVLVFARFNGALLTLLHKQQLMTEASQKTLAALQADVGDLKRDGDLRVDALREITEVLRSLKGDVAGRLSLLEGSTGELAAAHERLMHFLREARDKLPGEIVAALNPLLVSLLAETQTVRGDVSAALAQYEQQLLDVIQNLSLKEITLDDPHAV